MIIKLEKREIVYKYYPYYKPGESFPNVIDESEDQEDNWETDISKYKPYLFANKEDTWKFLKSRKYNNFPEEEKDFEIRIYENTN